ncbi:GDSL-type esterase/lipase family protein [Streptomyces sp. NPDC093089]|uniref:GDSL-type esterase/lipase family protein n=1 Tax=Streptomyces sp. NPDC093089 TaxID=3366024 RepID=UPI00382B10DF
MSGGPGDTIQELIDVAAGKAGALIQRIHTAAPGAEVVVVGYPRIMPDNAWSRQFNTPLAVGDIDYLRNAELSLNAAISTQAQANKATFVDTYHSTDGHDMCRPNEQRWVENVVVVNGTGKPLHPNQYGQIAMAGAVQRALG